MPAHKGQVGPITSREDAVGKDASNQRPNHMRHTSPSGLRIVHERDVTLVAMADDK